MEKTKVFVSVPMNGRTDDDINEDIIDAIQKDAAIYNLMSDTFKAYNEKTKYVTNQHCKKPEPEEEVKHEALWYLGNAFIEMSKCDRVVYAGEWQKARGCMMEAMAELLYF